MRHTQAAGNCCDVGKKLLEESDGKPTYAKHDTKNRKTYLRDCCRFAAAYTRSELKALLKLRSQQGTSLSWSVVRLLMTVKNKEKRKKLQKRAAEENWSVIRTTMFIQAKINRKKRSEGRHPCSPPPDDVEELIQQIERFLGESKSRYALWIEDLKQKKNKPSVKRISQRLRTRILDVSLRLQTVTARSRELAKMLDSIAKDDSKASKEPSAPAAESGSRKK